MQLQLEFADSEVSRVHLGPDGLTVRFSAAQVYQCRDSTPITETAGYSRDVELWLSGADISMPGGHCFGRVSVGRLELNGGWLKRIPLPFQGQGPVRLEFAFANGSEFSVSGSAIECRFNGEPNFAESLFCF